MIYVAWATMAFGVMLGYKSNLTFASTAFVTAMILMIAHWNWMDPSIGNLQPGRSAGRPIDRSAGRPIRNFFLYYFFILHLFL